MKRRRQFPSEQPAQDPSTGSPAPGGPVFLAVGRLRRPHGIHGEMIMDIMTDFPERLQVGRTLFVGDNHQPMKIASVRGHDRAMIIRFEGVETPEDAGRFRNFLLFIQASELPELPEDEYYHHQLIGLKVVDEAGNALGELTDILETGANDVYVIKTPEGKELLLPAVEEVVLEVNLEQGQMRVRPPEWT